MLTVLGYTGLAIVVVVVLFFAAAQLLPAGYQIAPVLRDEPIWDLPDGRAITPLEVETARLPVSLRGYRFAETDRLLDRLAEEIRLRDDEIVRLRGGAFSGSPARDLSSLVPPPAPVAEPCADPVPAPASDDE